VHSFQCKFIILCPEVRQNHL